MFRPPADAGIDVIVHVDLAARAAAAGGGATLMDQDDPLALLNDARIGMILPLGMRAAEHAFVLQGRVMLFDELSGFYWYCAEVSVASH